ncbi:MAG: PAS domain-containing protein [Gordonibacter sp.]|nr:PAS domain-containing protein [Gordonibacter sp.]
MSNASVLVVGCQELDQDSLSTFLPSQFGVVFVRNDVTAREYLESRKSKIVLILADAKKPEAFAIKLLEWMGESEFSQLPVIALTKDVKGELEVFEKGAWDCMTSPLDLSLMAVRVKNALMRCGLFSADEDDSTCSGAYGELEKTRVQMQHLINSIPGGIALYCMSDRFETRYFSDGVAALSGYTREEYATWIGNDAARAVYEPDRQRLMKVAVDAFRDGYPIDITYRIYHKEGHLVWVRLNGLPMEQTPEGVLVYAIFQEVSQHTELYQGVLDEIQTAVYACDAETYEILYFNRRIAEIAGVDPADAPGRKCYEYLFGRRKPCSFCRMESMQNGVMLEREFTYSVNNRTYLLKGKLFDWNNVVTHVEFIEDVTEQRAFQAKNDALVAQLTSMMDHVPGALCLYHYEGGSFTPLIHNDAFYQILGYSEEHVKQVYCETNYLNVHPDDLPELQRVVTDAVCRSTDLRHTYRMYHDKKACYIWLRLNARVIDQPDSSKMIYCTYTDVSEEKESERLAIAARERSEQQYRRQMEVIDGINDANLVAKGYCNLTHNQMLSYTTNSDHALEFPQGVSLEEVLSAIAEHAIDPLEAMQMRQTFDREKLINSFKQGDSETMMEYRWKLLDGRIAWVSTVCRTTLEPETSDILCFVYSFNITQRKTTQEMIGAVVKLDYDYLALLDCSTHDYVIYANKENSNLPPFHSTEYEAEVRKYAEECLIPEDVEGNIRDMSIDNIRTQLKDREYFVSYAGVKEKDGSISRKKLQFSYLDRVHERVLITRVDITDVYEKEQDHLKELQQAMIAANRANHAKTDFLTRMSHDIRTPMNAIIGLAELGEESESLEEMRENLHEIRVSGAYLLSIINDVLDMSRIESKSLVLNPRTVYLPRFIEETIAIIMPVISEKGIRFEITQEGITSKYLSFDETYVRQVAVNLLSNAVKFTPEGGTVELRLENISHGETFVRNRMVVRDSGIGISEDFLPKVFLPFEQENDTNDATRNGTGLGLSIVKSIVSLMNGTIKVESEKGVGTAFIVEWDLDVASDQQLEVESASAVEVSSCLRGKRILLCEDHPLNTKIAVKLLGKKEIEVVHAVNGQQALDMFKQYPPGYFDAVLMDIRMPIMDGLEATRCLRALDRVDASTVPIVAMTANAFDDDMRSSLAAGMNAHLTKPIEPQVLYRTLADITARKK